MFNQIETPQLILDKTRLKANAAQFLDLAQKNSFFLRPHMKTAKSKNVADIATDNRGSGITVSTLKEAEYFAADEYTDILCAAGITPNKFQYVKQIYETTGEQILLITDNLFVALAAVEFSDVEKCPMQFLIELDCGEHRGGIPVDSDTLIEIATLFHEAKNISFKGVLTHAGHSYATDNIEEIQEIAEAERKTAVFAAERISSIGIKSEIISVGSTPTALFAQSYEGITEVRAGVYMFFDLAQHSRKICTYDQIALSVLATVIGHNNANQSLIIDAGALALSKDSSANRFSSGTDYGLVCDATTLAGLDGLHVNNLHQEHGNIKLDDPIWFERLPIGSLVRILPNHACPTAAAYEKYLVIDEGKVITTWPRINGW